MKQLMFEVDQLRFELDVLRREVNGLRKKLGLREDKLDLLLGETSKQRNLRSSVQMELKFD